MSNRLDQLPIDPLRVIHSLREKAKLAGLNETEFALAITKGCAMIQACPPLLQPIYVELGAERATEIAKFIGLVIAEIFQDSLKQGE